MIGEWGKKKETISNGKPKQKNVHIPRQSLRMQLLEQLSDCHSLKWGYRLINFSGNNDGSIDLVFQANAKIEKAKANLVVGADGIRSVVRGLLMNEDSTPLHYTGYIVILGICHLEEIADTESSLLD